MDLGYAEKLRMPKGFDSCQSARTNRWFKYPARPGSAR